MNENSHNVMAEDREVETFKRFQDNKLEIAEYLIRKTQSLTESEGRVIDREKKDVDLDDIQKGEETASEDQESSMKTIEKEKSTECLIVKKQSLSVDILSSIQKDEISRGFEDNCHISDINFIESVEGKQSSFDSSDTIVKMQKSGSNLEFQKSHDVEQDDSKSSILNQVLEENITLSSSHRKRKKRNNRSKDEGRPASKKLKARAYDICHNCGEFGHLRFTCPKKKFLKKVVTQFSIDNKLSLTERDDKMADIQKNYVNLVDVQKDEADQVHQGMSNAKELDIPECSTEIKLNLSENISISDDIQKSETSQEPQGQHQNMGIAITNRQIRKEPYPIESESTVVDIQKNDIDTVGIHKEEANQGPTDMSTSNIKEHNSECSFEMEQLSTENTSILDNINISEIRQKCLGQHQEIDLEVNNKLSIDNKLSLTESENKMVDIQKNDVNLVDVQKDETDQVHQGMSNAKELDIPECSTKVKQILSENISISDDIQKNETSQEPQGQHQNMGIAITNSQIRKEPCPIESESTVADIQKNDIDTVGIHKEEANQGPTYMSTSNIKEHNSECSFEMEQLSTENRSILDNINISEIRQKSLGQHQEIDLEVNNKLSIDNKLSLTESENKMVDIQKNDVNLVDVQKDETDQVHQGMSNAKELDIPECSTEIKQILSENISISDDIQKNETNQEPQGQHQKKGIAITNCQIKKEQYRIGDNSSHLPLPPFAKRPSAHFAVTKEASGCSYCHAPRHNIRNCALYLELHVASRRRIAKARRLCYSCLENHFDVSCPDSRPCRYCGRLHLPLLCMGVSGVDRMAGQTELSMEGHGGLCDWNHRDLDDQWEALPPIVGERRHMHLEPRGYYDYDYYYHYYRSPSPPLVEYLRLEPRPTRHRRLMWCDVPYDENNHMIEIQLDGKEHNPVPAKTVNRSSESNQLSTIKDNLHKVRSKEREDANDYHCKKDNKRDLYSPISSSDLNEHDDSPKYTRKSKSKMRWSSDNRKEEEHDGGPKYDRKSKKRCSCRKSKYSKERTPVRTKTVNRSLVSGSKAHSATEFDQLNSVKQFLDTDRSREREDANDYHRNNPPRASPRSDKKENKRDKYSPISISDSDEHDDSPKYDRKSNTACSCRKSKLSKEQTPVQTKTVNRSFVSCSKAHSATEFDQLNSVKQFLDTVRSKETEDTDHRKKDNKRDKYSPISILNSEEQDGCPKYDRKSKTRCPRSKSRNSKDDKSRRSYEKPKEKDLGTLSDRLLFEKLPSSVTKYDLEKKMSELGEVLCVDFLRPGRALLRYRDPFDAARCIKLYDGSKVDGQTINVSYHDTW